MILGSMIKECEIKVENRGISDAQGWVSSSLGNVSIRYLNIVCQKWCISFSMIRVCIDSWEDSSKTKHKPFMLLKLKDEFRPKPTSYNLFHLPIIELHHITRYFILHIILKRLTVSSLIFFGNKYVIILDR